MCSSKVQQPGSAVELGAEATERFVGDLIRYLGVDLHRDCDLAVAQDAHGHAGMDIERGQ